MAGKMGALYTGYEGIWIKARRENFWYILNKVSSIVIAIVMAFITLLFKLDAIVYLKSEQNKKSGGDDISKSSANHM